MKKVIVYAAGVFDLLHYGHIRYLKEAKKLGTVLIIGLLTDEGTAKYKARKPVMSYLERLEVISSLKPVDYVVRQNDTDPTETLKEIYRVHKPLFPNILVRGSDVQPPIPGQEFIESKGGRVEFVPYTTEISSTQIKQRIQNG